MKEILLIGNGLKGTKLISDLMKQGDYKIRQAKTPLKALQLLKQNSPDFLMCTGKIRQTIDGKYFLELEG